MSKLNIKTLSIITAGIIIITFPGCKDIGKPKEPETITDVDQITRSIPDEATRKLWREAAEKGKLPDIKKIPIPLERVAKRKREILHPQEPEIKRPKIAEKSIADVLFFTNDTDLTKYIGPISISSIQPGLITGKLKDRKHELEIIYKIPDDTQNLRIKEKDSLELSFRDEVINSTVQRRAILSTKEGALSFFYLSEGSNQPYSETFKQPLISIKQRIKEEKGVYPVDVTYGNKVYTLKPGEKVKIRDQRGTITMFLISSVYTNPKMIAVSEGSPYYITLMIYRRTK